MSTGIGSDDATAGECGRLGCPHPVVDAASVQEDERRSALLAWSLGEADAMIAQFIQSRTARPVLTLALAGVTYALLSSTLAAVLSPILDGELQGPLTNPFALVSVLIVNAAWGAISGCLAWVIASAREHSSR